MKIKLLETQMHYDGTQLRSLYNYLEHGLLGDSAIAWIGGCNITLENMVDGEDQRANAKICGDKMIHFLIEVFHQSLPFGVALQRLFATIVADVTESHFKTNTSLFRREGDDLYWSDRKFSISIATVSPVSTLIHFAVNIVNQGTPVATCALEDFIDLKIDPKIGNDSPASPDLHHAARDIAQDCLARLAREVEDIQLATCKVHWVK